MRLPKSQKQFNTKTKVRKSLLIAVITVLAITIVFQLAFLSIFGTKGKEIAEIRAYQKRIILENELLKAEINKKQSLLRVKTIAQDELGMIQKKQFELITRSDQKNNELLSQN